MISIGNLQINKLCLGDVEVTKAYLGDVEVYGSNKKYMTITVLDGDTGTVISPNVTGTLSPNLQYRVNNGSWSDFIVGTTADIHAVAGDVVQFKGLNESGLSTSSLNYLNFAISGNHVSLSGNVMSLIDGVGDALVIPHDYCFYRLFHGSSIKTVSVDFLPATTITNGCYFDLFSDSLLENAPELHSLTMKDNCYRGMFYGCQHFTQAPELPATTLANGCYAFMLANCSSLVQVPSLPATELATECYRGIFQGCTALVTAPELPATELAPYCYNQMFFGCTALTQAPELPVTTLVEGCYQYMFYGDSSLNYVKSLATNITATNAIKQWLYGVAASGTFVKPYGVGYQTGISGIPQGWTVVNIDEPTQEKYLTMTVLDGDAGTTIAPKITGSIPNLNLQYRVNNGSWNDFIVGTTADIHAVAGDVVQFKGVNESGISTSDRNYLNFAISGNSVSLSGNVMSLIDGVGDALVIPRDYCFYKMFSKSNVKTVSLDFLPATTLTTWCYSDLFSESLLENSPELTAITMKEHCYRGMFYGCQNLTQAPTLPATKLAPYCYQGLFQNCTSLVTPPKILPAEVLKENCYYLMFSGSAIISAPEISAMVLERYCCASMFAKCTELTTAPILKSQALAEYCYNYLFDGCSKLNYVKSFAVGKIDYGISSWLRGVSQTGTFEKPAETMYSMNSTSGIPRGWSVEAIDFPTPGPLPPTPEPEGKYLTITSLDGYTGSSTISPQITGTLTNIPNLQYRINNGSWTDFNVDTMDDIRVDAGNFVQLKGLNPDGISDSDKNYLNFIIYGNPVSLSGNVMSLIDGVGDSTVIPSNYCFYKLFSKSTIKNISQDFLPALELKPFCYADLFGECILLENAPELPALKVYEESYRGLFYGCQSLTTAPELPATELDKYCYQGLFQKCTSLVNPPSVLPAQVLKEHCYKWMFVDTSITTTPEIKATVLAPYCCAYMFEGCRSLKSCSSLQSTSLSPYCYTYMFSNCFSLTVPPSLPASSLEPYCYSSMFSGCQKLTQAPALPSTSLAEGCYKSMFSNCRKLAQAPVLNCTTLVDNCYREMFRGCSALNYVKSMATEGTIKADGTAPLALQNWLSSVSSTGTFEKPASAVYVNDSPGGIPKGWTIQNI